MNTNIVKGQYSNTTLAKEIVSSAVRVLQDGKVLLYPTDTLYGLGVDATNKDAVAMLHNVKGSNPNKPQIVLVDGFEMLHTHAHVTDVAKKALTMCMHKPLTVLLTTKTHELDAVGHEDCVGFRIPTDVFCTHLVSQFGKPIVSTSANKSGQPYVGSIDSICTSLPIEKIGLVVDYGELPKSESSTIIDVRNKKVEIIREGTIPRSQFEPFM